MMSHLHQICQTVGVMGYKIMEGSLTLSFFLVGELGLPKNSERLTIRWRNEKDIQLYK
jgi:hypothetical protein